VERLLTIDQLSEILQVRKNTLYSWVFSRKIPHIKIGGLLRFQEKEISKWIDAQVKENRNL